VLARLLRQVLSGARHRLASGSVPSSLRRAHALRTANDLDGAIGCLRAALARHPRSSELRVALAAALDHAGDLAGAAHELAEAVALAPGRRDLVHALADAQGRARRFDLAAQTLARAVRDWPGESKLWARLGFARYEIGAIEESIAAYREAIARDPANADAREQVLFLHLLRSDDPEMLLAEHRAWAALAEQGRAPLAAPLANAPDPDRPLRLGYVSGDFYGHAISLFVEPLLARHAAGEFEITCYDNRAGADATTRRLAAYRVAWTKTVGWSDEDFARKVRQDRIDILVDLSGHTSRNRLRALALRCAPVQVTYLGYPATTGLAAVDYRLTDAFADPPGLTEAHYSERLLRLPHCLWCYRPAWPSAAERRVPLEGREVVFGSMNNFRKLAPRIVAVWGRLLGRVPRARLLIASLAEGPTRERVLGQLAAAGIARERIECVAWLNPDRFAELHARVDIVLDAFPFNGGTTTIEALWHGAPVVSLSGRSFASRAGRSILANAGLADLAVEEDERYVEVAARLALDRGRLARLHAELPDMMRRSPIMDEARFTADLESVLRAAWREWCARVSGSRPARP
jgi:predicted O-linked N-acetylglucosamine transferase (SPINDLY family)